MLTMDVRTDKPRVLYVDDETENLHGFKALFRRDYTILLAESAATALKVLRSERIDVLITDQRMPEMTGTDLLEVASREFPDTIRFMLTGYSDFAPLVAAINKGKVQGYFSKPINPDEVAAQIRKGLELSRLKERNTQLLAAYEQSQRLLGEAHALARLGVWSWDRATDTVTWSRELCRMMNRDPYQAPPRLDDLPEILAPESVRRLTDAIHRALDNGDNYDVELECAGDTGKTRWVNALGGPSKNGDGHVTGLHGTVQDITESKRFRQELRQARDAAEEASRAKSDFLANMSHEIRTPLSGLMGVLHLLEAGRLDAEQRALVGMALRSGERLTRLLADLLDLSRIEAGRMLINIEAFRLEETLTAVREAFEPLCRDKNLPIVIDVAADVPATLVGDEVRIRQVLFNFVGNALKFTMQGRIEIRVARLRGRTAREVRLLVTVADSGIGIPENKLGLLCKPFSQITRSYTRAQQGAGLGLTISHRLVEALGGAMTIDSIEGQGTTVWLMLPLGLAPEDTNQDMPTPDGPPSRSRPLRILLVEDDDICRITATALLTRMGHVVQTAAHGDEAIDQLRQSRFDCVLMDVQMPTMDGLTATRLIRSGMAGVLDPSVPIVAQTAYAMPAERDLFLGAGMNGYICKPLSIRDLETVLERLDRTS